MNITSVNDLCLYVASHYILQLGVIDLITAFVFAVSTFNQARQAASTAIRALNMMTQSAIRSVVHSGPDATRKEDRMLTVASIESGEGGQLITLVTLTKL